MNSMVSCNNIISKLGYDLFMKSVISFKEENIKYEERYLYPIVQRVLPKLNKNTPLSPQIVIKPPARFHPIYDYPKVVLNFIKNMPAPWNKPSVRIKNVRYMENQKIVFILGLKNTKYCLNINREHKNNNIYFVVKPDLSGFTQKCTNCISYESDIISLNHDLFLTSKEEKEIFKNKSIRNLYHL